MKYNGVYTKPNGLADYLPLSVGGSHGYDHWERVCQNGLTIARINGADELIVSLFAWLHDARRENEYSDPEHGRRATLLAQELNGVVYELDDIQLGKLLWALELHDKGGTDTDITVGTCWDADRLDLPRVGILPDPKLMSTDIGKLMAREMRVRWAIDNELLE